MINVAVVGLGFMGVTHLKAYRKIGEANISAICDAVRLPRDGVLGGIGGNVGTDEAVRLDMSRVRAYERFEDVLADPQVQLVDLCVPTPDHPRLAIAALKAGKHVICEKPMARTAAQAEDMVRAAESASTFFMPAMCMRFWPGWDWLKQTIDAATYGRALSARFRRVSSPPGWSRNSYFKGTDSGGALLDLHIHDVDFIQHCFGRPRRVLSRGLTRFSGAIDHVVTQYDVASGTEVHAEGSWIMGEGFGFNMSFTVVFEKAMADFDSSRGAEALRLYEEGQAPRTLTPGGIDGYVGELEHMVFSIRDNKAPERVTARDGLGAVEICEAEEKSVLTGEIVALG